MRRSALSMALAGALAAAPVAAAVLTGSVESTEAQRLLAPPSLTSPETLQYFVPDGTRVEKGQPVLRIDASSASGQIDTLRDQIALARAKHAKDLAALELKAVDARLALVTARNTLAKAAIDAGIPKNLITALDYDKYQGAFESATRDAALKQKDLAAAQAAVDRQGKDNALDLRKLELELAFYQGQVGQATVAAAHAGVVVHGFQTFSINGSAPGQYHDGSMVFPGTEVGQVVGDGRQFRVQAWALQPDRRGLKAGQAVRVHFDALPDADVGGRVAAISAAAESRSEWGGGHYYRVDVALDGAAGKLALLPGMSARVETDTGADRPPSPAPTDGDRNLHATGDIVAVRSWDVMAPQVAGLWQLTIEQMAPDGSRVAKGQPLATFAAGTLAQDLPAQQSELAEKERARTQLGFQLADDARDAELAVAKAQADADKAVRKASMPKAYVAGIEYRKLVIDRESARQTLALTRARAAVAAASRKAQLAEADAEVAQARTKLKRTQEAMASLTVHAPRAGLFLHAANYDGSKIDQGSQVFFGSSVGSMPDMDSLAVRASLPERDLPRVHVGQAVQVVLSGGASRTLDGHIADIGRNVHSRSAAEPIPVVDLDVKLDSSDAGLKPGRSARVDIPLRPGGAT
ncbi:HlyD family efflux transporter periplasmic adaptor subunit [Fulvimonas sp. R45]|uniref:HlyD family efflux transporter periplasmic adaptor subunit n=1 Tax=Fulvimonas sp. R45 TaxID=3045937 RepID=UPI0026603AC4|nr:HlyD family efflux transporter periplasmic adaptor subunit [Fulvimonas sp. R45]MDO1529196.1 HlyD family efflux transporter periplasmic adaptor subunit [Fulvimonas sp. R45]